MAAYARALFGIAAIFYGFIGLLWHDAATVQSAYFMTKLPFGMSLLLALKLVEIVGGVCIVFPRTARPGALLLAAVAIVTMLVTLGSIAPMATHVIAYDPIFENLSLLCGAIAVFGGNRRFVRIGLGLCALAFMGAQWLELRPTASLVPTWIPPNQLFWAILTTIAFGLAGLAMLTGVRSRLAMQLTALMIAIFGLAVWLPKLFIMPPVHVVWSEFGLTYLIAFAFLVGANS